MVGFRVALIKWTRQAGAVGQAKDEVTEPQRLPQELANLLQSEEAIDLLNTQAPDAEQAKDLRTARKYAGKIALLAVQFGYENGFTQGPATHRVVYSSHKDDSSSFFVKSKNFVKLTSHVRT